MTGKATRSRAGVRWAVAGLLGVAVAGALATQMPGIVRYLKARSM
ncbi:hypothetical protein [Saccharomonospora saliphila]|nr:hypothetical protein [Saccharomonospora saliphila]